LDWEDWVYLAIAVVAFSFIAAVVNLYFEQKAANKKLKTPRSLDNKSTDRKSK
jgi:hypothetical protein